MLITYYNFADAAMERARSDFAAPYPASQTVRGAGVQIHAKGAMFLGTAPDIIILLHVLASCALLEYLPTVP